MKILDRITRKAEIQTLGQLVEAQQRTLDETRQALAITETLAMQSRNELRDLKEETEVWRSLGGDNSNRELTDQDREKLVKSSNKTYYETPEGRAIIKNLTNYIVGQGVHWTAQDENPDVQQFIDDFCAAPGVRFGKRQISIVSRTLREGELFIHLLTNSKGVTHALRFYPAGEMTPVKDPNDAETVREYERRIGSKNDPEHIPADQIHHIRLEADEDVDRGRPLMEPVLKRIAQYGKWLNDRIITNAAKTGIYLDVSVDGSPSRVATVAGGLPSTSKGAYTEDSYATQVPRAGTAWCHSKAIEAKWTAPNINADDCKEDGRQIRLSIAAGVQMPEYLLSSDASNASYASTTVAESPFIKAIEAWRKFFEEEFKLLFASIIKKGIQGGALPDNSTETVMKESGVKRVLVLKAMKEAAESPDVVNQLDTQLSAVVQDEEQYEQRTIPTKTEVDFEWPSIVTRNIWEETQALDTHYRNGWVSKDTCQMKFGYDPEEESRKIAKEREDDVTGNDAYRRMRDEITQGKLDVEKEKQNKGEEDEQQD